MAGVSVFVEAWQASRAWAGSAEAQHADVPSAVPIWLDEAEAAASPRSPAPSTLAVPTSLSQPLLHAPDRDERVVSSPTAAPAESPAPADPPAQPAVEAAPGDIAVAEVDFRFLDPPEPGAHARLALSVFNRSSAPSGPISLIVPARWLEDFRVFGAVPDVLDDRAHGEGERRYMFGGLGPGERQTLELHLLASAEEIDGPEVRILVGDEAEIGRMRPRTVAPRPRPGPARSVNIPKLGVRAAVVPVPWEPPPFVVGQLHGTAALSEGNTVLIGHLAGPLGDVFTRLDRLRPGDEVVAMSRGLEYRFVVSEIAVKPYDDVLPTQPTATPRLTLMTCTGQWSVARQDYSHRLWVVAEPPELAQQTIRANAERASQAAREAEASAAARATHEAETAELRATPTIPVPHLTAPIAQAPMPVAESPPEAAPVESGTLAPGLAIDAPTKTALVSRRFTVRGRRMAEADPGAPLWLLVRAEVPGSRWYALDRPLEPDWNGSWQVEVELGGPPGIRHEIRAGVADEAADRMLRRHAAERAGQPLDDLPAGFRTGASVTVERAR